MSLPQVSSLDTARSTSQRNTTPEIAPNNTAAGQNAQSGMQLRNEFLQMMVAQIQNQDPTNPWMVPSMLPSWPSSAWWKGWKA